MMPRSLFPVPVHPAGRIVTHGQASGSLSRYEVIDFHGDGAGKPFYYRAQLESGTIKYFTVAETKPIGFAYHLYDAFGFSEVPNGDWNLAHLVHRKEDDKLVIASTEEMQCPAEAGWTDLTIDVIELGPLLRETSSEAILLDAFTGSGILEKTAANIDTELKGQLRVLARWDPWRFWNHRSKLMMETEVYGWVQGLGISLPFLGYLTEMDGTRVIGYLVEPVAVRWATLDDTDACRGALGKFHSVGIALGSVHRISFLVRENGAGVLLHRFWAEYKTRDPEVFALEMAKVDMVLKEEEAITPRDRLWREGDGISESAPQQLREIIDRDGDTHPLLLWEARNEGTVTATEAEHRALMEMFARRGGIWHPGDTEEAVRQREENGGRWVPLKLGDHRTE